MFNLQPPRHISTLHEAGQSIYDGLSAAGKADMRVLTRGSGYDPDLTLVPLIGCIMPAIPADCFSPILYTTTRFQFVGIRCNSIN
jgi:hypothetical protein